MSKFSVNKFFRPLSGSVLVFMLLSSCASTEKNGDRTPRRVNEMEAPSIVSEMKLSRAAPEAQTIQLYRSQDETSLPILTLSSSERLNLEFDLLTGDGRPLSIYFYHADRQWERDLSPAEYLGSFQRDNLLDYTPSRATEIPYVHYRYSFPNESIQFLVSGNYILRVTEQGEEERIIFEKPFFISEQRASVELAFESVVLSGFSSTGVQPFATFVPPAAIEANVFNFAVCFVRNGINGGSRCSDRPSLMKQPALEFYLQPSSIFEPAASDYFLDLTQLRHSNRIERIDMTESPFEVTLEPDLGRLGAPGVGPPLNGQMLVSQADHDVVQPDLNGQYVNVQFRFVPEGGRRFGADLYVVGPFNQWTPDESSKMIWVPENTRYEGSLLIKQGQYDYRYVSTNASLNSRLQKGIPRLDNLYTAFVYYNDISIQTDRLLSVGGSKR